VNSLNRPKEVLQCLLRSWKLTLLLWTRTMQCLVWTSTESKNILEHLTCCYFRGNLVPACLHSPCQIKSVHRLRHITRDCWASKIAVRRKPCPSHSSCWCCACCLPPPKVMCPMATVRPPYTFWSCSTLFNGKSPPLPGSWFSHRHLNFACAVTVGFKTHDTVCSSRHTSLRSRFKEFRVVNYYYYYYYYCYCLYN
jgi:hypothetical protein